MNDVKYTQHENIAPHLYSSPKQEIALYRCSYLGNHGNPLIEIHTSAITPKGIEFIGLLIIERVMSVSLRVV